MNPPGPARQVPEPSPRLVVLFRLETAPSLNIPPTGVAPALALAALASVSLSSIHATSVVTGAGHENVQLEDSVEQLHICCLL